MSAAACGSIENTVESDPCFRGRFKAILHEPTEALKINRYIHLNPVRIAALGGHETRDVAAHKITAQLARRRVDALEQYRWGSYAFFLPVNVWMVRAGIVVATAGGTISSG